MFKGSPRLPFRRSSTALLALLVGALSACVSTPEYQGLTPEQLYERGLAAYEEEDWAEAAEILDRLLLSTPGFPQEAEARIRLARAFFNDERYITAQQEFTRFVERHPGHEYAPEAALGVCRTFAELSPITQRDQTYTQQAAFVCQGVAQDYRAIDDEVAAQALEIANEMRAKLAEKVYDNAEFYASRDQWDSAIIYYETIVEQYADTEWAPRAIVGLIEAYRAIEYPEEVEEWRLRLLNSYPQSPEARALAENGTA